MDLLRYQVSLNIFTEILAFKCKFVFIMKVIKWIDSLPLSREREFCCQDSSHLLFWYSNSNTFISENSVFKPFLISKISYRIIFLFDSARCNPWKRMQKCNIFFCRSELIFFFYFELRVGIIQFFPKNNFQRKVAR